MSPHAILFKPQPHRPVCYRTRTPWWHRALKVLAVWAVLGCLVTGLVMGTTTVIARMHVTQAQLDAAYLAGMATGQLTCGSR